MNTGDLAKYRQALLGVGDIKAPGGDFNANADTASAIKHIQNMYSGDFQGAAAGRALNAAGGAATAESNQEQADAKLRLQREQEKQQHLQDELKYITNPNNYKQVIDHKTGGYKYYDPLGNQISVKQYASATNQYMTEILKHSKDPNDVAYVDGSKALMALGQAFQGGDRAAADKVFKKYPGLKEGYDKLKDKLGREPTWSQMVSVFQNSHPNYYSINPVPEADKKELPYNGFWSFLPGV